jgi:UDP-N-acetylmuramoyl-tripeptide--D-alanyl-D-alanine ligase
VVPDTLHALGEIARGARERFEGPVVAITGSNGKTTTKELCADILAAGGIRVRRSRGNLNNHIGLPLSILSLESGDQALVVELGMNHAGEIAALAQIAQPDVGAITQVAPAHLGPLGSLQAIGRAKGELFDHLRAQGTAVLNVDDPEVMAQAPRFAGRALRFGFAANAEFRAEPLEGERRFRLHTPTGSTEVSLALPGRHLIADALCAAACAHASGALGERGLDAMRAGIEGFRGVPGRLTLRDAPGDVIVLDDSYNSNPQSLAAALATAAELRGARRLIAALGDMKELGDTEAELHADAGRLAVQAGVDVLVCVGPLAFHMAEAARAAGSATVLHVDDATAAATELAAIVRAGDLVLIKGSRTMEMERAVSAVVEDD